MFFCLPISFATAALKIVFGWSMVQNPTEQNCQTFANHPALTLPVWTAAYQWDVGGAEVKEGTNAVFYISRIEASQTGELIEKKNSKERHKNWEIA